MHVESDAQDTDWEAEWQTEVEERLMLCEGIDQPTREASEVHAELRARYGL